MFTKAELIMIEIGLHERKAFLTRLVDDLPDGQRKLDEVLALIKKVQDLQKDNS